MIVRELINKIGFKLDEASLRRVEQRVKKGAERLSSIGRKMSLALTLPLLGLGGLSLKAASDVEQLQISFETMLGSAEKAQRFIKEMLIFAAKTPFEIENIGPTVKQLLAVGIESEKVIPTLKSLGDVASGLSIPLSRLVLNYGQVKSQARLTGRELRDFAISGVPLLAELAKQMNKSEKEITEMVSRAEIGFPQVEQAFKDMSSEGGRFANLMIKQSKTLGGLWSNFLDILFLVRAEVGKIIIKELSLKEIFLDLIEGLQKLVEWFKRLSPPIKRLIVLFTGLLALTGPLFAFVGTLTALFISFGGAIFAIPAAILLMIAMLALFIEDVMVWQKGGKSLIGKFLGSWELFREKFLGIFENVREGIANIWERIKLIFKGFIEFIHSIYLLDSQKAVEAILKIWKGLIPSYKSEVTDELEALWQGSLDRQKTATEKAIDSIMKAWKILPWFFENLFNSVDFIFNAFIVPLKDSFNDFIIFTGKVMLGLIDILVGTKLKEKFQNLIKGLEITARLIEPFITIGRAPEPAFAGGFGGGGRARGVGTTGTFTQNVNVRSEISLQLPPGTAELQREFIEAAAKEIFTEGNEKAYRHVLNSNPETE